MQKSPTLKEIRPHGSKTFPCAVYRTQFTGKDSFVKHHWHDEIEILYFFGGDFRLEINMEQFLVQSECLYFINSGELHSIVTEKSGSLGEYAIVFNPSVLNLEPSDAVQLQLIQPIQNGKLLFPRVLMPEHPAFLSIRDTFIDIIDFMKNPPVKENAQMLIPIEKNNNKRVEEIKAVLTYIKEHYKEKIYIRDLAGLINMNEQYFCRFFKKAIGRSPIEYINEYRIRQSVHLLADTDLSVTEICLELKAECRQLFYCILWQGEQKA